MEISGTRIALFEKQPLNNGQLSTKFLHLLPDKSRNFGWYLSKILSISLIHGLTLFSWIYFMNAYLGVSRPDNVI